MKRTLTLILLLWSASAFGQESLSSARTKVLGFNQEEKFINFAFITDVHASSKVTLDRHAEVNLEHFVTLCNERWCDFAAFGGDMFSAYEATRQEALELMSIPMGWFNRISIPVFMTKGNHDRNAKLTQEETVTNTQYHLLCEQHLDGADVHFNELDPYGNYYYADYACEKVRVIVLNYFDRAVMQDMGFHDHQLKWLEECAFGTLEDGWTVIMFSHEYTKADERFWNIVEAVNGTGKVRIAALVHGHTHRDLYVRKHGINIVGVRCGFCEASQLGTPDQDCFSIFTIDTRNNVLRETRVGHGKNREFSF